MRPMIRAMTTLPLFKIKTNYNQVPPDENEKSSQLLGLAKSEDQEDGVRWEIAE